MANVKMFKLLGVMLALVLIVWAISPFLRHQPITMFNPGWTKAVFFFEGIVIGVSGYMLLAYPYSIEFVIVGLIIVIIAILAYMQKLPPSILKWFYR